jgi:N6-adenosine-specific RNA methylase IME4
VTEYGEYATVYVDPPWRYSTSLPGFGKKEGEVWKRPGSVVPYPTMTIAQIAALPIGQIGARDSHLYLWMTNAFVEAGYRIARQWGWEPSILLPWCKAPRGFAGFPTYSIATEYLLFCRRGTLRPLMRWPRNWFEYKRGKHSAKPPEFAEIIELVSPGPRCELFARDNRAGWASWGNECASDPGIAAIMASVIGSEAWNLSGQTSARSRAPSAR